MLAISVDNAAEHFPMQQHSSMPVLPTEKKILCPCTSVLDSFSLDFWINEKAATLHHERQEYFLLLGFAMLCNGFGIQNHAAIRQPKKGSIISAVVSLVRWLTFHSSIYVLFNFQSSNSLMGISEYHSGCTHVKILGKLFSIPCGRGFYSPILKIGQGNFVPYPIAHKETENIRWL